VRAGWGKYRGLFSWTRGDNRGTSGKKVVYSKPFFSNPQYQKFMVLSPANLHFIFPKPLVLVLSFQSDFKTFSPAPSSSHHLNPSPNGSFKTVMHSMSKKLANIPSLYLALILI
jgi:hypothetical protein